MNWVAIYTQPVHRVEFRVLHAINQQEYQAMLPFEVVWVKKPGSKLPYKEKRFALFPRYVFACLPDVADDYQRLRDAVPEIAGIVSKRRSEWSPYVLNDSQVAFVKREVDKSGSVLTEVDLHKALKPGKAIEVDVGGVWQDTTVQEVSKRGVRALLKILGDMPISVEVPFNKVRAA